MQALNICIALVERRRVLESAHEQGTASPPMASDRMLEVQAVDSLAPHTASLLSKLGEEQSERRQVRPHTHPALNICATCTLQWTVSWTVVTQNSRECCDVLCRRRRMACCSRRWAPRG